MIDMKIIKAGYEIEKGINGMEIIKQIERVGRTCYKSEDKITDGSAIVFVQGLIKRGHEAMIEHNSISVRFICDRGISHELVRHRLASFGQESTRYCNYSQGKHGSELTFIDIREGIALNRKMDNLPEDVKVQIMAEWFDAIKDSEYHYNRLIAMGTPPELARDVTATSLKTEIVVTMNLREWRHFFKLRTEKVAHPQMRQVTIPLLADFKKLIPIVFDDIEVIE